VDLPRQRHGHGGQVGIAHVAALESASSPLGFRLEHRHLALETELIQKIRQVKMELTPVVRPRRDLLK